METDWFDRRRVRPVSVSDWKRKITAEQADTLRSLELVGWSLRFVRMDGENAPLAAVYNPDNNSLAVIEPDGRLVENPKLRFRG
ncbi:MAG TPA: hypothetical protein VLB69_08330 [Rudaea sp.]|nr:hypothetical protein [Rudaea sp.]